MPQYPFLQAMYVAAIAAIVGTGLALPVGARLGSRAGRRVLRGTVIALAVALVSCLIWGSRSGDLAAFNARLGVDAWVQMVAFFGIALSTAYHFVGRYLDDRATREREATGPAAAGGSESAGGSHDGPGAAETPEGGPSDA